MARILVIHADRGARRFLEERAGVHHIVRSVDTYARGIRAIAVFRPGLLIAAMNPKSSAAFDLLRYLKRNRIDLPVVLVGPAGAGVLAPMAMKLGAAAFVEYPMEQSSLDQAIAHARQADTDAHGDVPPVSEHELTSNLSEMEKQLNRRMVCVAGKNQVYLQSLILGGGRTSKPRIALKCSLRKEYGHPPDVYYEYIRDICCGDPSGCPAFEEFKARSSA